MSTNFAQAQQQVMLMYLQTTMASARASSTRLDLAPHPMLSYPLPQIASQTLQTSGISTTPSIPSRNAVSVLSEDSSEEIQDDSLVCLSNTEGDFKDELPEKAAGTTTQHSEQLVAAFIELVSERTGYPSDMLDPALDLESDLGIDSIKRIEILNKFRTMLPESTQQLLETSFERVAGARTIDEIANWIRETISVNPETPDFEV